MTISVASAARNHNLDEAERLADWVGILRRRLLVFDTLGNLQRGAGANRIVRFGLGAESLRWRAALEGMPGVESVALDGSALKASVREPATTIPAIVAALVAAGATVHEVTPERSTLEAVYLASIRESA